ncbi:MAG TPA: hypothetical protein VMT18_09960 [Planctomycetota bacterium]|nr:hypothetical protein [Planctomycetota bacterium]
MNATLRSSLLVLSALFGLLAACAAPEQGVPPPGLAGSWVGEGNVNVEWVSRRRLSVALDITPYGSVTGRVGDARLVDARVRSNRNDLGRGLGLWTDWIVEGRLEGELLADEAFVAQRVSIPFDVVAGRLVGRVHAEGAFLDGRRGGRLDAIEMTLVRR